MLGEQPVAGTAGFAPQAAGGWWARARWNLDRALIVTRREVRDTFRDWRILVPIFILTIVFPFIANWGAGRMVRWVEQFGAAIVAQRFVPFLLMIVGFFPTSFSLIIALESFVGEKERRSLEPLLSTPLTNVQLYIGKTLSATVPPVVASLLGILVYAVGVWISIDWRPPTMLLVQIILLTMLQALVMVSGAVVVSTQSTSVRAANLLASFIIIPMSFLIQAEALIMFWARYDVLWLIIAALAVVDVLLVRMGARSFNREELLGREIDELNLFGTVRRLASAALARREGGPRRGAWRWYREEVLGAVWRMRGALVLGLVVMLAGAAIGARYAALYRLPAGVFRLDDWYVRFTDVLSQSGLAGLRGVGLILWQNVRALLIGSALAVFTFGVAVLLILMLPTLLIGFAAAQIAAAGLAPGVLAAALVPHSLFEIPAVLVAGAAAVRLGASVIAPPPGRTIAQGWLEALGEAARLWFALVLPLLAAAAVVEIAVTPLVVRLAAGG